MKADALARYREGLLPAALLVAAAAVVAITLRPLLPIDETRYMTVAWEMWLRGDLLVPHLNGAPYPHKPPLLFWTINLVWWLFGVSAGAARALSPLFAIVTAALGLRLARRLWPEMPGAAGALPLMLVATTTYLVFSTLVMFDVMLTFFVVLGVLATVERARGGGLVWWAVFALALGAGLLTKGPIALLQLSPVPLLAPLWQRRDMPIRWTGWYAGFLVATVAGALICLAWALPAAEAGGADYARAILWSQTADRVAAGLGHPRPWWFYIVLLPVLLHPWGWMPGAWRGLARQIRGDAGLRLCACWLLPVFLILCAVHGKQLHYLLPVLPAVALALARVTTAPGYRWRPVDALLPMLPIALFGLAVIAWPALHTLWLARDPKAEVPLWATAIKPHWGLAFLAIAILAVYLQRPGRAPRVATAAFAVCAFFVAAHLFAARSIFPIYDLAPLSRFLGQRAELPIAYNKGYKGEFGFLGRLKRPVAYVRDSAMPQWLDKHGPGLVVLRYNVPPPFVSGPPAVEQQYRGQWLAVWVMDGADQKKRKAEGAPAR